MKKRSGFQVMLRLVGLVRPLAGFMALAILLGLAGHLCAAFLTVLGGYALAGALGLEIPFSLGLLFGGVLVFAVARGFLRYGEQACNHFIAFKLLALLREKVFQALRRLCPAKLEGKDRGNLIALITSDIELLEVFYAHTLSPIAIAALFTVALCLYIGSFHWALGLLALAAYAVVGVVVPLVTSRLSGDDGLRFRQRSGELSSFVLDSLRGLSETLQYGQGQRRLEEMDARTAALSQDEARMKRTAGRNQAVTNTVILVFDVAMLFAAAGLSGGPAAHAGADELLWTLCGAGQPGQHLAEHLRRGEPGAGHFGGGAGGGGNPGQGRPLLYRGGGGTSLLCLWGGADPGRRLRGGAQGQRGGHCGPQRQREIHTA